MFLKALSSSLSCGVRKEATQGLDEEQENHLAVGERSCHTGQAGDSGPVRAIGSEVIGLRRPFLDDCQNSLLLKQAPLLRALGRRQASFFRSTMSSSQIVLVRVSIAMMKTP